MGNSVKCHKIQRFLRIITGIVLILVILFGALFAFVWSKLNLIDYSDFSRVPVSNSGGSNANLSDGSIIDPITGEVLTPSADSNDRFNDNLDLHTDENVLNILLIGTDERTTEYIENARADSMILVSINKKLHTVRLISLERGIGVPVLEGDLKGQHDLLTHIFRWGGADLLLRTVRHCFEVDVDLYVRLNFAAVEKIVDAVGGIDMYLDAREVTKIQGTPVEVTDYSDAGLYRLNGKQALSFARLRSIDSDWKRVERQRKVILAVVNELKGASLMKLNDLANVTLPLIQTNMTQWEVAELIFYAPNFLKSEFDQMTIPKQGTYHGVVPNGSGFNVDFEINSNLIHRFLYEGVSSEELLAE